MSAKYSCCLLLLLLTGRLVAADPVVNCVIVYDNVVPAGADSTYNRRMATFIANQVMEHVPGFRNAHFRFADYHFVARGNQVAPVYISPYTFDFSSSSVFEKSIRGILDELGTPGAAGEVEASAALHALLTYLNKAFQPADHTYFIYFSHYVVDNTTPPYFRFEDQYYGQHYLRYFDHDVYRYIPHGINIYLYELLPARSVLAVTPDTIRLKRQTTADKGIRLVPDGDPDGFRVHLADSSLALEPVSYAATARNPAPVFTTPWPLQWCTAPAGPPCLPLPAQATLRTGTRLPVAELLAPHLRLDPQNRDTAYAVVDGSLRLKARFLNGVYDQLYYQADYPLRLQVAPPAVARYAFRDDVTLTNAALLAHAGGREMTDKEVLAELQSKRKKILLIVAGILAACLVVTVILYQRISLPTRPPSLARPKVPGWLGKTF